MSLVPPGHLTSKTWNLALPSQYPCTLTAQIPYQYRDVIPMDDSLTRRKSGSQKLAPSKLREEVR